MLTALHSFQSLALRTHGPSFMFWLLHTDTPAHKEEGPPTQGRAGKKIYKGDRQVISRRARSDKSADQTM